MIVSLSSLALGLVVGYLGQRSRMCSIGGLRDFVLVRDTGLLRGAGALLATSWVAFAVARLIHHSGGGHGLIASGTTPSGLGAVAAIVVGAVVLGFAATLSGACPLRQHVLAGQGRVGAWSFLAGFYLAAIVYTSWIQPSIGSWVL
ncbi:MAG TPA: YeeE/YedE thiosulfate transporter family protein [Gaiellaceae bacterium]|nr:YeeE/YedE thiosulfate transporter family protein [Gaiellaceae bacterium]